MIRIGGGIFKARAIKIPKTKLTRVSTSYFRKVIFDTLSPYTDKAELLDLFAGSGSLGIEGISRGAKTAVFVENSTIAYRVIKENITALKITDKCKVLKQDALKFLKTEKGSSFTIIFLDPPYSLPISDIENILREIDKGTLLKENGIVCIEVTTKYVKEITGINFSHFSLFKEKKKGDTTMLFYKKDTV